MAADVIPVYVSGCGGNGLIRQLAHRIADIADAETCVNQQAALRSVQKIAMGFFPVPVFADDVCIAVDLVNGKPIVHKNLLLGLKWTTPPVRRAV